MINKTVFVAGGNGFLGKRIVKKLKEKKQYKVVSASLTSGVDFRNFNKTLTYFRKNKADIVIHSAAYIGGIKFGLDHAGEVYFNNILISTNLIEAARLTGVELFISPIANCAYPDVVNKDFKESEFWNGPLHPSVMVYGMVRKAQWAQTWAYARQYGMKFINLVLPNMYGPGDYFDPERSHALGALLMKIINAKKKGLSEVVVWGTGKPVREWLYVDDGAEALIKAINIDYFIEPINIGVGKGITILDLAKLIKKIVGYKGRLVFDKTKPDGAPYKVMDVSLCKKIFKWLPETGIEQGIKTTYKSYLND
ncbi:MAG: NAD-dependent epimerase/dehydratase family protein [Candidatus Levybacteria bacterium]|nr:NAD-dependent epimerase/dehydratase family protein [Candidatus Levybacteria bacterium]